MTDTVIHCVELGFQSGSSDKIYRVSLVETRTGFLVPCEYGRRGSTMNHTSQTPSGPVDRAQAQHLFDVTVRKKLAKGYVDLGGDFAGTRPPLAPSARPGASPVMPQLLNAISLEDVEQYLADPEWIMQVKEDGERRIVQRFSNTVVGYNRKGQEVPLPEVLVDALLTLPETWDLLDGEQIGDTFIAFDDLSDIKRPFGARVGSLNLHFEHCTNPLIRVVATADQEAIKRDLFEVAQWMNREGVVFRRCDSMHAPGRPNSGGPALKCKFTQSATVRVAKVNAKRSIGMEMREGDRVVPVGNCTIPPNKEIPPVGSIVEVSYLYAYPGDGGCLAQPQYKGPRDDQDESDDRSQLKFKAAAEAAAA